jgi:accessory gene regulator B
MELLISSAVGTILLIIVGIVLNALIESLCFIVGFSLLRIFTGGFHSRSFILCNIITLLIFGVTIAIYRYLYFALVTPFVYSSIFGLSFALSLLFAPVVNTNNPISKNAYRKCKAKSLIVVVLESVIFIALFYIFGITQITVLLPTLFSVDVLMIVPLLKK